MAKKVQTILVDDLDGGKAEETVSFALDGTAYEIDLNGKNAGKLRNAFAPYVGAARKGRRAAGARATTARKASVSSGRNQAADIRAWAKTKGLKVSQRGRIPADIVAQYRAAR